MASTVFESSDLPQEPLWLKVTGMLKQNWALVVEETAMEEGGMPPARILFFNDHGHLFDELKYPTGAQADADLPFNGFTPLCDKPGFQRHGGIPKFPLTYSRWPSNHGVYSSGKYWKHRPNLQRFTKRREMTPLGLERFVEAQEYVMETVLEELRAGHKTTHWMWFVFPQLYGLGNSANAERYGIVNRDEARAYLEHPVLGPRLQECFRLVLEHKDLSAEEIFGSIDAKKFHSCATLFYLVVNTADSVFYQVLSAFFKGDTDGFTSREL